MKAIARYPDHGSGIHTCDVLEYLLKPVKNNPSCPDRVAWIGGDLDGYGLISRKPALMATALDFGHEHLLDRRYWHVILSCETCADQESRADAEARLRKSAPLLAALHGAKRYLAVIHCDTDCPHLHLIIANFDEGAYCRFTYDRAFLKKVQSMEWTTHLESGKGTRKGISGPRGEAITAIREHRKKEDPDKRNTALAKLRAYCERNVSTKRYVDTLARALDGLDLPASWYGARLMTTRGKPMKNASVTIDGVIIRLAFYLRWLRGMEKRQKIVPKRTRKTPKLTKSQPEPVLPKPKSTRSTHEYES